MNNVGEALECFVKDAFANCLHIEQESEKEEKYRAVFSWCGSQNHPPDIMLRQGDAIEVKKTQSALSDLALNSSYPKATLRSDSEMITQSCRDCEEWSEKELIYCVGHTSDDSIKSLWMVYGSIYAANDETYRIIKQKISEGINEIPNTELAETKELGRVNKVDSLGITNLRIRGMWQLQNPRKTFHYLHTPSASTFELVAIIPTSKYTQFPSSSRARIEHLNNPRLEIRESSVKDPNDPEKHIPVHVIVFTCD